MTGSEENDWRRLCNPSTNGADKQEQVRRLNRTWLTDWKVQYSNDTDADEQQIVHNRDVESG